MTKTLKPLPKSLDQTDIAGLEQLHSEMLATCHDLDLTPSPGSLVTISDMDLEAARGVVRVLHAEIREHLEKTVASDDKKEDTSSKKTESVQQRMARQKAAREERDASQPKKEKTVAKKPTAKATATTSKKKVVKTAKKATATTSKKKVASNGHAKFADEQTITWIRKEEGLGAREGSGREERRKILKRSSGKTVAKYLELGGSISTLGRAVEEKLVSVK